MTGTCVLLGASSRVWNKVGRVFTCSELLCDSCARRQSLLDLCVFFCFSPSARFSCSDYSPLCLSLLAPYSSRQATVRITSPQSVSVRALVSEWGLCVSRLLVTINCAIIPLPRPAPCVHLRSLCLTRFIFPPSPSPFSPFADSLLLLMSSLFFSRNHFSPSGLTSLLHACFYFFSFLFVYLKVKCLCGNELCRL